MCQHENINTEYKSIFKSDIKKEIVAFANTNGGNLYIGISDTHNIIGVEHPDNVLLQVTNLIRDSIKPDITLFTESTIEVMGNKKIIKVYIQRGADRPYFLKDKGLKPTGVYIRQGSASAPASYDSIRQMIKETDGEKFESIRSIKQDLTFKDLEKEMKKRELEFGISQQKTLNILSKDDIYTNLGLLLSDQCKHSIKIAYFQDTTKNQFKDRKEFTGSLFLQLSEAYQYIELINKTSSSFEGLQRIDNRDYPPEALRETLLNAIIHREYSFSGSTLINIYEDRIEFITLGGLVSGITKEAIMIGISQSRNENLANVFYRSKLIEVYGTGITKIFESYKDYEVEPVINALDSAFQVILPNTNYKNYDKKPYIVKEEKIAYSKSLKITMQHQKILELFKHKKHLTRKDFENALDIGQTRALLVIKEMINLSIIRAVGNGKNTQYIKNKII
jgi:ATP-dependent DNA helicase RecG